MGRRAHIYFVLIWINIILVNGVRKDVCDKCVKIEDCPMFAHMPRHEQEIWLEQVPCDGSQSTGGSSVFGFSSIAKGDYICCPNSNVWGIEQDGGSNRTQTPPQIRPNDQNRPIQGNLNPHQQNNFGHQQTPLDQDIYNQPHNFGNPQTKPLPSNPNIFGNQQNGVNGQDPYGRPSNFPSNSIYNNNQPQQKPGNNFGNPQNGANIPNPYGRPSNPIYGNQPNGPNGIYNNPQMRPDGTNIYGQQPNGPNGAYGNRPTQYPNNGMNAGNLGQNYPYNQYPNSQGQIQNPYGQRPYLGQQQPNSYPNNGGPNQDQQCAVRTSYPPDPSSGCCGQDMSDSDRITDLQSILNMYAPSNQQRPQNNWPQQNGYPQQQNYSPRPYYPQTMSRRKRSTENSTISDDDVVLDDRIAGGKETELDQFPWTVLLKVTFDYGDKQSSFSCGGSLISPKYVLTAGHCVYEKGATVTDIELTLAEYDKSTFPRDCKNVMGEGRQCVDNVVMHAEDIVRHPKYDDDRLHNDIALIRLHGYAPYTRFIRSVCLPPVDIDNPDFSNLPLAVAGWGRNGPYVTDIKQSTVVHLVPHDECEKSYPHLSRTHLCAAGRTGEDTCKGDSGGPLMMLYRGSYYIIGVVSGKRADSPCGSTVPSLYTNVFQYVQWITSNMRN